MRAELRAGQECCAKSGEPGEEDYQAILCKVPVFRPVAVKLLQVLNGEEVSVAHVAKLLSSDPAFSAEVLTMANSAGYGLRNRVNTIERAVMVLGTERTRSLATRIALHGLVSAAGPGSAIDACWGHSRATAVIAEWLAPFYHIHPDRAYTAGIMHDIGRLGLLSAEPKQYPLLLSTTSGANSDLLAAERSAFKVDHCEAGFWLTKTWGLPEEFWAVCAEHHLEKNKTRTQISDLVRLACALAQALGHKAAPKIDSIEIDKLWSELRAFAQRDSIDTSGLSSRLEQELPASSGTSAA
jgi:HD-like signal output (HDOD) protein